MSSTLNNGLVNLGNVVNTYAGHFQSAGTAYNLELPWEADCIQWYNYTKYATNSQNLQGIWFKDFPAGDALIVARGTTDLTSTLETTNGVTDASTSGGFPDEHLTVSGISAGGVVTTSAAHGLTDNDRVILSGVVGTMAAEVNGVLFKIVVASTTTFQLYTIQGVLFDPVGTYTSGGKVNKVLYRGGTVNVSPQYLYTLGSAVVGNNDDEIYFIAYKFNNYTDLGDVA